MNNYKSIWCAALIALSIVTLGFNIKGGIDNFANKDRKVSVKGLAEKEVDADKVTWPIVSKELGNDLPELYKRLGDTQQKIKHFLTSNGVKPDEISVNAPSVIDLNADQYSNNQRAYRYNITSVITVTSRNVKLVRSIIARQGELLKEGVAIVDGGYENLLVYFLYRHFARGALDGRLAARVFFCAVSVWFICLMNTKCLRDTGAFTPWDRIVCTKDYSKQVEYSAENMEDMIDALHSDPAFAAERLKLLFG